MNCPICNRLLRQISKYNWICSFQTMERDHFSLTKITSNEGKDKMSFFAHSLGNNYYQFAFFPEIINVSVNYKQIASFNVIDNIIEIPKNIEELIQLSRRFEKLLLLK